MFVGVRIFSWLLLLEWLGSFSWNHRIVVWLCAGDSRWSGVCDAVTRVAAEMHMLH
jgi:hypothetical protein